MKKDLQDILHEVTYYVELLIAVLLSVVVVLMTLKFTIGAINVYIGGGEILIGDFLERMMMLAVGLEFVKMLCKHTPSTVVEVLLFATARQMVVEHTSTLETLIGVVAIAGLFATRKFLLCHFDEIEKRVYRASQKTKITNVMSRINIPLEDGETLGMVVKNKLKSEERTIAVGACVWYKDFALRIDSMRGDKITRIELIKSL